MSQLWYNIETMGRWTCEHTVGWEKGIRELCIRYLGCKERKPIQVTLIIFHTSKDKWHQFGMSQILHRKSLAAVYPVLLMGILSGKVLAPDHQIPVTSNPLEQKQMSQHRQGCALHWLRTSAWANRQASACSEANRSRMVLSKQLEALKMECKFGTDDLDWRLITLMQYKHHIL